MWWCSSIFCNNPENKAVANATRVLLQPVYLASLFFLENSNRLKLVPVSKHYNDLDRIPEHESVPHPVGELFTVNRDHEIHLYAGVGEATIHEKSREDGNHTVSTCFGGQVSETRLSICTSHILATKCVFKINYSTDLRRDAYCNLYACHKLDENSILLTSFQDGLSTEPILEAEFQQTRGRFQTSGKLERNLTNGHQSFMFQSKVKGPSDFLLRNTIRTHLRGDASLGVEYLSSPDSPCLSSRFIVGVNGTKELSLHGSRNVWKTSLFEASAFTNFNSNKYIRFEAKHKINKEDEIAIKFKTDCYNINEINLNVLLSYHDNFWKFKYRKTNEDGHCLGLDWSRRQSCNFYSFNIECNIHNFYINGDISYNF